MEEIKEKSADEMFEELGYQDSPCGYGAKRYNKNQRFITFYKKEIMISSSTDRVNLKAKELKAINKKIEELGW